MKSATTLERGQQRPSPAEAARKILLDNDQVTVIESSYPAGGGVPMHAHRFPHVAYVIEGGQVETTSADGRATVVDLHAGQALWRSPQNHSTRNVGSTPLRVVEVEIKGALASAGGEPKARATVPGELQWAPDPMDPSRRMALLVGDPARPGPYTVRIRVAAGYTFRLHAHPAEDETLTVISGALHWSTGEAGSVAAEHRVPAGGFVMFPAGTPHRLWVTEETELQMSGVGPHVYHYPGAR